MTSSNREIVNWSFSTREVTFVVANMEIGTSVVGFLWRWLMKATIESGFT